jgi:uncharacterized protein (DUF1778 family)
MAHTQTQERGTRTVTINLRAHPRQKTLIDCAARTLGKNRSDFMLEAACGRADAVLCDQRNFVLDAKTFDRFVKALDKPPAPNAPLRRLLHTKAPWER